MNAGRVLFVLICLAVLPLRAHAAFDWGLYGSLLKTYVTPGTRDGVRVNLVDYAGLKADPMFSQLLGEMRAYDTLLLTNRKEREAFYINAYNMLSLEVVASHWPVKSIKDIGNPVQNAWDELVLQNMNGQFSLKGIREKELVPMGDLRALFAIDCVAVGGPNLRRVPYEASTLDAQLNAQVRQYLASRKALQLRNGTAHLSILFDRYQNAFDEWGGVKAFLQRFRPGLKATRYVPDLHYDWNINASK